jgi:hypothetical protein
MEGTRGMGIDPQPILIDEVYDEAALSSAMRASASESKGTMWHIVLVAPTTMQLFYGGSM